MVLLPVTLLFVGAALAASLTVAQAAGNVPVAQAVEAETCIDIPIELPLSAADTDNDVVLYQLTEEPRLGTAKIEGNILTYSPGHKTGKDRFSFTAVDADGNTAKPVQITITISKNRAGLTYADMSGNPAHYAAICLAVTRSEFITMATAVSGLPVEPTTQTDFVDDSGLSAWAKPFISTAAANGLVSGYRTASGLSEIRGQNPITLAEASVIINNLLDGELDGTQYVLAGEHSTDMDWAARAVSTLTRLDVLSPLASMQGENEPITRQTACEILYNTMQLIGA